MRKNKGFSLVEIIVVTLIVGFFVTFAGYLLWINWSSVNMGEKLLDLQMQARSSAREISDNLRKCSSFVVYNNNKYLSLTFLGSSAPDFIYRFNNDTLERSTDNEATYNIISYNIDSANSEFRQVGESVDIELVLSGQALFARDPSQLIIETTATRRNR